MRRAKTCRHARLPIRGGGIYGSLSFDYAKTEQVYAVDSGGGADIHHAPHRCRCRLRIFGRPIEGTYELVGLGGAVVIGFALPITSWLRCHIFVDFFIQSLSAFWKAVFDVGTRAFSFGLFVLIGYNLLLYAGELYKSGEVTATRQLPFYPVAFGIGFCCFIQCLVLIADVVKIAGGRYE